MIYIYTKCFKRKPRRTPSKLPTKVQWYEVSGLKPRDAVIPSISRLPQWRHLGRDGRLFAKQHMTTTFPRKLIPREESRNIASYKHQRLTSPWIVWKVRNHSRHSPEPLMCVGTRDRPPRLAAVWWRNQSVPTPVVGLAPRAFSIRRAQTPLHARTHAREHYSRHYHDHAHAPPTFPCPRR